MQLIPKKRWFAALQAGLRRGLLSSRRGAVSLLFATAVIPLLMMVGLAVDFGLYNQAESQLNMAADAASIHAARIAALLKLQNDPAFLAKGQTAGQDWFAAQLGTLPQSKAINPPIVQMSYDDTSSSVTAHVSYTGVILAHFGNLFPNSWPNWPNWNIGGAATAVIANPSYVEVLMLLDNSSSMLIGASADDITQMERLTPCSTQSAHEGQPIDVDYSWAYTAQPDGEWLWNPMSSTLSTTPTQGNPNVFLPYGFGSFIYTDTNKTLTYQQDVVPTKPRVGHCDQRYTGISACVYPGSLPDVSTATATLGQCTNGGGGAGSIAPPNTGTPAGFVQLEHMPQAPCAFACHNDASGNGNDYWGLVQQHPSIETRYSVLHQAAGRIITAMSTSFDPSHLTVGVYEFSEPGLPSDPVGLTKVYPAAGEAGPVNGDGSSDPAAATADIKPPITDDRPDTNFENAMTLMDADVSAAGSGFNASSPKKNLFIVTDGMDDYYTNNDPKQPRIQGPFSPAACTTLKNEGFKIYVLYTQYYPLPNPYYLENDRQYTERPAGGGPSQIEAAMDACSSNNPDDPQNYFYEATDKQSINTALNNMLAATLAAAGRLSN